MAVVLLRPDELRCSGAPGRIAAPGWIDGGRGVARGTPPRGVATPLVRDVVESPGVNASAPPAKRLLGRTDPVTEPAYCDGAAGRSCG